MDADYSVELGPTAPALEIPWQDPDGRLHYVDLRSAPDSMERNVDRNIEQNIEQNVERIPEARQFPALRQFLIKLNSPLSPWQTVKCDVWTSEANPAENLYNAEFTQNCYVDLVLASPSPTSSATTLSATLPAMLSTTATTSRGNLELHQRAARSIALLLEVNESLQATAEIVVRRCYFHRLPEDAASARSGSKPSDKAGELEESDAGYCLTLFLTGHGASPAEAATCWDRAMEFTAACLLQSNLESSPG